MAREEENTKAAIANSDSNDGATLIKCIIEHLDYGKNKLDERSYTLYEEYIDHPGKEFLALDLCKFLEDYREVKVDIEHYIRHRLEQLRTYLQELSQEYCKRIMELEQQQLKEKENDTELHLRLYRL